MIFFWIYNIPKIFLLLFPCPIFLGLPISETMKRESHWYTYARHACEGQGEAVRDQTGPSQAITSCDVRGCPRDILDLRLQLPR